MNNTRRIKTFIGAMIAGRRNHRTDTRDSSATPCTPTSPWRFWHWLRLRRG